MAIILIVAVMMTILVDADTVDRVGGDDGKKAKMIIMIQNQNCATLPLRQHR